MEARGFVRELGADCPPGRPRSFTGLPKGLPAPAGISILAVVEGCVRDIGEREDKRERSGIVEFIPGAVETGRTSERPATVRGAEDPWDTVGR